LVRRLNWRIRAGSLRRILALWVLALRWILVVRLRNPLGRHGRLLLLLLLLLTLLFLLGLHGKGLSGDSLVVEQESAGLTAYEETMQRPGESCDE